MDVEPEPIKKHTFKSQRCLLRTINKEEFEEHIGTRHEIKCDNCNQEFPIGKSFFEIRKEQFSPFSLVRCVNLRRSKIYEHKLKYVNIYTVHS